LQLPAYAVELAQSMAAKSLQPMDALRTLISAQCADDVPGSDHDAALNRQRSIRLTARCPALIAAYHRARNGKAPLPPRADLNLAANFLYMLTGEIPDPAAASMFDKCLVLHAEHGFNASTFAARVTIATLSDIYSAVASAIGTLKGPLHGGANTAVMLALLEIGTVEGVVPWLEQMLATKGRVMGFGHRVYRVPDPRAAVLREFSSQMGEIRGDRRWFEMTALLEKEMQRRKGIACNVDLYSASTYYSMGIEPDLFTTIFALARMPGWTAHVMEQLANNRLIRPQSGWVGAAPRRYVKLDRR
jgi:citrate synthase